MLADDIATASAKAKKEEAGANVCPGLTSLWQWFIARLGYSWAPLKLPHRNPSSPPACLRGTDTVAAIRCRRSAQPRIAATLSRCMPWSAPLTTHSHTAQEEPSAQPLGETMHSCPRCPYLNL